MDTKTASRCAVALIVSAAFFGGDQRAAAQLHVDVEAAVRTQFAAQIARYSMLRARLEEPLPSFDVPRDSWADFLTRRYLASAIRTARAQARTGDIFTPEVAALFRSTVDRAVYELDLEGLVDEELEDADFLVDLVANEPVPKWALQPLPAALVARLPVLPEAIYYARVGTSLILWDAHADILIDGLRDTF